MGKNIETVALSKEFNNFANSPAPLWLTSSKEIILNGLKSYLKEISSCVGADRPEYKTIKPVGGADIERFKQLISNSERMYVEHISKCVSNIMRCYSMLKEKSATDLKSLLAARRSFLINFSSCVGAISSEISYGPSEVLDKKFPGIGKPGFSMDIQKIYDYYKNNINDMDDLEKRENIQKIIRHCLFAMVGQNEAFKKNEENLEKIMNAWNKKDICFSPKINNFFENDFKFDVSAVKEEEYCWETGSNPFSKGASDIIKTSFNNISNAFVSLLRKEECPLLLKICQDEFNEFKNFYNDSIESIQNLIVKYDQNSDEDKKSLQSNVANLLVNVTSVGDEFANKLKNMGLTKANKVSYHDSWKDLRDIIARSLEEVQKENCNLFSDTTILYKEHQASDGFKESVYDILIPLELAKIIHKNRIYKLESVYINLNMDKLEDSIVDYGTRIKKKKVLLDVKNLDSLYRIQANEKGNGQIFRLKQVNKFEYGVEDLIVQKRLQGTNVYFFTNNVASGNLNGSFFVVPESWILSQANKEQAIITQFNGSQSKAHKILKSSTNKKGPMVLFYFKDQELFKINDAKKISNNLFKKDVLMLENAEINEIIKNIKK